MNPEIPTVQAPMGGRRVVQINGVEIPSFMLGETSINIEEGTRESTRLSGTTTRPSRVIDTAEATIVFYPNEWQDLAHFFPEYYNAPSGAGNFGNIILGGGSCSTTEPVPVNIHDECSDTDDKDVYFFAALARITLDPTFNESDDVAVTITLHPQQTIEGLVRLGTGDLTQDSIYNAATRGTETVTS